MKRKLSSAEIATLEAQGNRAEDWTLIEISPNTDLSRIANCRFYGTVSIGDIGSNIQTSEGFPIEEGIFDSAICNSSIGDHPYIHKVGMMAHYHVGDHCLLYCIDEMIGDKADDPKFVWIEVINENGHRAILPFAGMTVSDAYLWARYRGHRLLMDRLENITKEYRHHQGALNSIGAHAVLKSIRSIQRVAILSSEQAPTRVEQCVTLFDGVVGFGCHLSSGVMAERFVLGEHVHLEMGARINDSVVGDNSTIARCEVGCSMIFPAHEQHHNNSFLIASVVMGQSNAAAGATIGSNHNSRTADGEIEAHRGFWPGLCTSLKHNSRFASYCLLAKGQYPAELNIPFPFALVNNNAATDQLEVMPAYWWMYNMYALDRNARKFAARDKRTYRHQHVEFSLWAPDVIEEIMEASRLLKLPKDQLDATLNALEHGKRKAVLIKSKEAVAAYREMIEYYAIHTLMTQYRGELPPQLAFDLPRHTSWTNLGGQIVQTPDIDELIREIEHGTLDSWYLIHNHIDYLWDRYPADKATHAYSLLCDLYKCAIIEQHQWKRITKRYHELEALIEERKTSSRHKDNTNPFRRATCESDEEYWAVYPDASPSNK